MVHCLKDIRLRLRNMGPIVESNEAIRCEYISVILHACINIVLSSLVTINTRKLLQGNSYYVEFIPDNKGTYNDSLCR